MINGTMVDSVMTEEVYNVVEIDMQCPTGGECPTIFDTVDREGGDDLV